MVNLFKLKRKGSLLVELTLVLTIVSLITLWVVFKAASETENTAVDGLKQEMVTIITKTKSIALQRSNKFNGLDEAGLCGYGKTIPYTFMAGSSNLAAGVCTGADGIASKAVGGCKWTVTPDASGSKISVGLDCDDNAGWKSSLDTQAKVANSIKDYATLNFNLSSTDVVTTNFNSAGNMVLTINNLY